MQRYICTHCGKTFSSNRRPNRLHEAIFQDYFNHRFTLSELSRKYDHSRQWIQKKIHTFIPDLTQREARKATVVIDATFFGKRFDRFGLIVAKDANQKEPIAYNFIETETKEVYRDLIEQIHFKGHTIQAVVLDGKPGIFGLFEGVPVQMCHFHMQTIMTRKLTQNPKLEAAIKLKRIVSCLGKISPCRFEYWLLSWHKRYEVFLNEKVTDESKRGWHYKHRRLRSAYRSLVRFLPFLFTYLKHPQLNIPSTTNLLDGGCFSPLKDKLKVHRGASKNMQRKMIVFFLENRRK